MSTATVPPLGGRIVGLSVDRQFKQCDKCGGKIQVDKMQYPGEGEESEPVYEYVESHIGSCTPPPTEDVPPAPEAQTP